MKTFKRALLFLPMAFLLVFASCNQQEEVPSSMDQSQPTIATSPDIDITCCAECGDHCILGYDFQANVSDPNFPQGGYKVALVEGDCECNWGNNGIQVLTQGSTTWSFGYTGGPAGGAACVSSPGYLATQLFNSYCSGNWMTSTGTSSPGYIGGTFPAFSEYVRLQALTYEDPNDAPIIGLMNWPASWNISVTESFGNKINITLGTSTQAPRLRRIGIFPAGPGTAVEFAAGDGSMSYELDMSAQPTGAYTVKLDFWPGFHLIKTIENIVPRSGK